MSANIALKTSLGDTGNLPDTPFVKAGLIDNEINSQSGTTYTLVLSDAGKLIRMSNSAAITLTIPTNATAAIPIGNKTDVEQVAAGVISVTGAVGVTINPAAKKTWGQYSVITLQKVAADVWNIIGGSE